MLCHVLTIMFVQNLLALTGNLQHLETSYLTLYGLSTQSSSRYAKVKWPFIEKINNSEEDSNEDFALTTTI